MKETNLYIVEQVKDELEARHFLESKCLDWDDSITNDAGHISFFKGKEKVAIFINLHPREVMIFKWALR